MHDLELLNLSKTYPGSPPAVSNVCLQAARGEFISLVGPSGCGKTTTLRMIAGFEDISSGQIIVRGKDIGRLPPEQRPTSTIFQNFALFPHMTVRENIEFGLRVKKLDSAERSSRVNRMLELFELGSVADRRSSGLSGGQRQRVALARGLAVQPDILLLDEPLGALDANLRKSIQQELKLLQREVGITFVFVTHAQSEALVLSDRIVVMNSGRAEQIATPYELYTRPATEFVARFMGRNAILRGRIDAVEGNTATLETPFGRLKGRMNHTKVKPGDRAALVIPSEAMDLSGTNQAPGGSGGGLKGTVVGQTYTGQSVRLTIRLIDGEEISVERHEQSIGLLTESSEVMVSWPSEEATVIASQAEH